MFCTPNTVTSGPMLCYSSLNDVFVVAIIEGDILITMMEFFIFG